MARPIGADAVGLLSDQSVFLWTLAIVFFGVGDLVTTMVGLSFDQIIEVGPLAAHVVPYGTSMLGVLKVSTILLCVGIWKITPAPHRVGVPLGLATLGILVTIWNLAVLWMVLN